MKLHLSITLPNEKTCRIRLYAGDRIDICRHVYTEAETTRDLLFELAELHTDVFGEMMDELASNVQPGD